MQAENFRKLLLAMVDDIRVILVKLADRLHNLRTLEYLPEGKRKAIAGETLDIYVPIANRLGMAKIRAEMEDLAFAQLDPASFQNIVVQVEEKRKNAEQFSRQVIRTLKEELQELGIEAEVEYRIKRIYSTYQKMKRQKIDLDQVYDFVAIRVLVDSVEDCYRVLGIVNNTWRPVPHRIKDMIASPRPNRYQSLHTTVIGREGRPFEVQIRTHTMNRIAKQGIAAHWKYKEGRLEEHKDDKRFQWLRQLLEWQHEVKDPHQFLSNLKIDLYPDEVYAFTPKGELITLPRGATPVDFGYAIHTEVGNRAVSARVNGRIVPLKYRLHNGDSVEIVTSARGRPSREWASFVRTSRARSAVRRWINLKKKKEAIELGQRRLEKEARAYRLSLRRYQERLEALAGEFGAADKDDLFAQIGLHKLSPTDVLKKLDPEKTRQAPVEPTESPLARVVTRFLGRSDPGLEVSGHDDALVYRAQCCNPIRGEEVIGYVTSGRGISVHSVDCANLEKLLLSPERKIDISWTHDGFETNYPVRLVISTEDRTGILAEITSAIYAADTNILTANAGTVDNRYGQIDMTVEIHDIKHLDRILNRLKAIQGVRDVERAREHLSSTRNRGGSPPEALSE